MPLSQNKNPATAVYCVHRSVSSPCFLSISTHPLHLIFHTECYCDSSFIFPFPPSMSLMSALHQMTIQMKEEKKFWKIQELLFSSLIIIISLLLIIHYPDSFIWYWICHHFCFFSLLSFHSWWSPGFSCHYHSLRRGEREMRPNWRGTRNMITIIRDEG